MLPRLVEMLKPDLWKMKYAVVESNTVVSNLVDFVQLSCAGPMKPFVDSSGWILRVGLLLLVCNNVERLVRVLWRLKSHGYYC